MKESVPVQETCGNENPTDDSSTQGDPGGNHSKEEGITNDENGRPSVNYS